MTRQGGWKTTQARIKPMLKSLWLATCVTLSVASPLWSAEPLRIVIPAQTPTADGRFMMGASQTPAGEFLTVDRRSLRLNGKAWVPAMGEFHFSRYPESEWRDELLKMKAGQLQIVATYVFWIHHQEQEGQFDWSGQRNLRRFAELCRDVGLKLVVRCGPWCHGEVRNGGLPDWVLQRGWRVRTDDPRYIEKVRLLYGEIAAQLEGLLWEDGGPVIGIQVENEYGGPAEHLLTLKRLAREAGLDVPLYTRTGWPALRTPMPFGEILPLYGGYAEGFWDREITPMPGKYWMAFMFSPLRTDSAIATDLLGDRSAEDAPDAAAYPYLTCEIGGGMMTSYHRRVLIDPADVESTTLTKLGSGSTLPGYYMYHGGVNPEGRLTTLQESQSTGYANDLPVKSYDFQAPLGQYGQIRPHYHLLRRLHLWLDDWGSALAGMPATMPQTRPTGRDDVDTLRWSVRSDGRSGFVFVNNYQRLQTMPAKTDVQFALELPTGELTFPQQPIAVPADSRFIWPFQLELASDVQLTYATAQWVCSLMDDNAHTIFFEETPGVLAEFVFHGAGLTVESTAGPTERSEDRVRVRNVKPGTGVAMTLHTEGDATIQIVLLNRPDSLALWKADWLGRERIFHTRAGLVVDGARLRLTSSDPAELTVGVFPCPDADALDRGGATVSTDGVFCRFTAAAPSNRSATVVAEQLKPAGPPRTIPLGNIDRPVPEAPNDADFAEAAVWRINLPDDLELPERPLLRVHYAGDVARVTLDGKLLVDDFYNGRPLEIGLWRYAPHAFKGDLQIAILPLREDALIYLAKKARPARNGATSAAEIQRAEIVPTYTVTLAPNASSDSPD